MDLTENSHTKQIMGIVLVVVFLLTICIFGSRDHRPFKGCSVVKTVKAENTPVEAQTK